MTSPHRNVFVMTSGGEKFILRMSGKAPQLTSMTENDLIKSPLQRSFKDVVPRGADVNVSVVPTGSLRINRSNASSVFGQL